MAKDKMKTKRRKEKPEISRKRQLTDSRSTGRHGLRKNAVRKSGPPKFLSTHYISEPAKRHSASKAIPKSNPKFCKGKSTQYTVEDMNKAIELVHTGSTVIEAAFQFGIPRASMFSRSRDGCKTHSGRCSEVYSRASIGEKVWQTRKRQKMMQYTPEMVERAIEAVHDGMPVIEAAILYDIPRASLFIRSSKGCPTHLGRCSTVSSSGKLHRSKTGRFKYHKLVQSKGQQEHNMEEAPFPKPGTDTSESTADSFTETASHSTAVSAIVVAETVPRLLEVASLDVGAPEVPDTVHVEECKPILLPGQKTVEDKSCEQELVFDALTNAVQVKLKRSSADDYYK